MLEKPILRSYELEHQINHGKQDTIRTILKEYRNTAKLIAKDQWLLFHETYQFNKNAKINVQSKLLARYQQTVQYQVVGQLDGHIKALQVEFEEKVKRSTVANKPKLYMLNKNCEWYNDDTAKAIWRLVRKRHNLPDFSNINMHLDDKVAKIRPSKDGSFDYWITLSTLEKYKTIDLPLVTNEYYENEQGTRKNFCHINFDENNDITIRLIKEKDKVPCKPKTEKIPLDIGLKHPIVTGNGDLFGRKFYQRLCEFDRKITKLASNRQRQVLDVRSKHYDKLVRKFRNFLKNELNRIINRIVKIYNPKEIVVERLNFCNSNLSKRLNRLLNNFGKRIIKEKLNNLNVINGIIITETNPAYTSQECSNCHYIDKRNRKSQEVFHCLFCGKKLHADVNGARNNLSRSSDKDINVYKSVAQVLHILVNRFVEQERKRRCSPARNLLLGSLLLKDQFRASNDHSTVIKGLSA